MRRAAAAHWMEKTIAVHIAGMPVTYSMSNAIVVIPVAPMKANLQFDHRTACGSPIQKDLITSQGFGESRFIVSNDTPLL
jgi:hypothetical protein